MSNTVLLIPDCSCCTKDYKFQFSDLDLMDKCKNNCRSELLNCIVDCGDNSDCSSQCSRDQIICDNDCPCMSGGPCYDGCDGCNHEVCRCEDFELNSDYLECRQNVMNNNLDCLILCGDMDSPEVTECENNCILILKDEYAKCPCQVIKK